MSLILSIESYDNSKHVVLEGFKPIMIDNERITEKSVPCTNNGIEELVKFLDEHQISLKDGYATTNDVHCQMIDVVNVLNQKLKRQSELRHYSKVREAAIKFNVTVEQVNGILNFFN